MKEDKLINLNNVLECVQVSRSKLLSMVQNGTFPAPKPIGRNTLWSLLEIQEFIENAKKQEVA